MIAKYVSLHYPMSFIDLPYDRPHINDLDLLTLLFSYFVVDLHMEQYIHHSQPHHTRSTKKQNHVIFPSHIYTRTNYTTNIVFYVNHFFLLILSFLFFLSITLVLCFSLHCSCLFSHRWTVFLYDFVTANCFAKAAPLSAANCEWIKIKVGLEKERALVNQ